MDETQLLPKRNKATTMQKICDAAFEIFSNHDYKNASTKKIAEKAGVNSALIFNYFVDKSGLFNYVLNNTRIQDMEEFNYAHKENFTDELKSFVSEYIKYIIKRRKLLRSMYFLRNYENMCEFDGLYPERSKNIAQHLEYLQKEGKIRADMDCKKFALDFLHVVDGTVATFSVYSNETPEYTLDKLYGIIDLLAKGAEVK